MKDKPIMYKNNIKKEFHNSMNVYNSFEDKKMLYENNNIRKRINMIINSNDFIYSKLVNIVIGDDIIKRKIIGIYGNNIVTIDKEYIPIDNIKDIYV